MKRRFIISTGILVLLLVSVYIVQSFNLMSGNLRQAWFPGLVVVAALVDSINPCAFSILFLTMAFLFSLGRDRKNIFKVGMSYILGIFLVYLLIGLGVLQVLSFFNIPNFMSKVGAVAILLAGMINLLNEFFPAFPIKLKIPKSTHATLAKQIEKASVPAGFILGVTVGLFEFPCTGGPYLMILGLLHDQAQYWRGFMYLLLYDAIFVLPLFLILLISSDKVLLEKVEKLKKSKSSQMGIISSFVMIGIGLLILFI
jgi:cytochrome c biogenesis protein CcdA